jgi:hypothetical protein
MTRSLTLASLAFSVLSPFASRAETFEITDDDQQIKIVTQELEAAIRKKGYVCMIEEFGGRPIKAGESFSAAFIVGYFDSIEEMHDVYDRYKGCTALTVNDGKWDLTH